VKTVSIDPGLSGAICIFVGNELVELHDMPIIENGGGFVKRRVDAEMLAELLWPHCDAEAAIEWVTAMPGNGGASMFSFGATLGACMGVLGAIGIPVSRYTPQEWHKILELPKPDKTLTKEQAKRAGKTYNRELAATLQPAHANLFKRIKDHDRADALLIGQAHIKMRK
jgi:crossover junction endodeoxyribonuclease RuvC